VRSFVAGSSNNATDLARFYAFCLIFDQVEKDGLPGDVAELGVYKGHTATLLAKFVRRQQRTLYLLDTFEGFVSEDLQGVDATQQVQFQDTDLDSVSKVVGRENVVFIKGRFPDTASMLPASGQYAIVHVDCDLYAPVLAALEYFYPRLVAGGYLVIHDYASLWWPGAEQAVDEFFADKPESVVLLPDISGSVAVRKMKQIKG
jgi:O-methyltransferase